MKFLIIIGLLTILFAFLNQQDSDCPDRRELVEIELCDSINITIFMGECLKNYRSQMEGETGTRYWTKECMKEARLKFCEVHKAIVYYKRGEPRDTVWCKWTKRGHEIKLCDE